MAAVPAEFVTVSSLTLNLSLGLTGQEQSTLLMRRHAVFISVEDSKKLCSRFFCGVFEVKERIAVSFEVINRLKD